MKCAIGLLILLLFVYAAGPAVSAPALVIDTREKALLNAFEIMCNLEHPVFDHIDAHATAMKMHLVKQDAGPSNEGTTTRKKAWLGSLKSGPFFLFDDEMSGAKGTVTACAVGGPVPSADAFRTEAIKELEPKGDVQREVGSDGALSLSWAGASGPGTTLIVRSTPQAAGQGVMVKLVSMVPKR